MTRLTLAQASQIVDAALVEGRKRNFAPLCVVVLDAAGVVLAMKRQETASLLRPQIATGKAYGCLAMGFGGRELLRRSQLMPAFFNALIEMSDGKMVPVPGGVLVKDAAGGILGAVGVTGDTSENDEICALAGIAAAGLSADTGEIKS